MFCLQRNLSQRFKSKDSKKRNRNHESCARSDTSELPASFLIKNNSCAEKSATVDINKTFNQIVDREHKSDSDEGDFEIISEEQLREMADNQNGIENAETQREIAETQRQNAETQRENAEKTDQFPQQVTNKNANWNMMELGEKRKRLR